MVRAPNGTSQSNAAPASPSAGGIRVCRQQVAARLQRVAEFGDHCRELPAIADVIQHLAADDQVLIRRQRVGDQIDPLEGDVRAVATPHAGPVERDVRDVGRRQPADAAGKPGGEVPFGTPDFERPLDRFIGEQRQRLVVFGLFVGGGVFPGIGSGKYRFEVMTPECVRCRTGAVIRSPIAMAPPAGEDLRHIGDWCEGDSLRRSTTSSPAASAASRRSAADDRRKCGVPRRLEPTWRPAAPADHQRRRAGGESPGQRRRPIPAPHRRVRTAGSRRVPAHRRHGRTS